MSDFYEDEGDRDFLLGRIDALKQRLEELEKELQNTIEKANAGTGTLAVAAARGIRAEAEITRLREALEILATVDESEALDADADRMQDFAAQALRGEGN